MSESGYQFAVMLPYVSNSGFPLPDRVGDRLRGRDGVRQIEFALASKDRGGLVCLNSAARFDKWNRAAVR